jgi:hypothetical protein
LHSATFNNGVLFLAPYPPEDHETLNQVRFSPSACGGASRYLSFCFRASRMRRLWNNPVICRAAAIPCGVAVRGGSVYTYAVTPHVAAEA